MKKKVIGSIFVSMIFLFSCSFDSNGLPAKDEIAFSSSEQELYDLIMNYRGAQTLDSVPFSPSLTLVAQTHAKDLELYADTFAAGCTLGSWSANGDWSAFCYTPDHANAQEMWDKPAELTSYPGYGYEITYTASGTLDPAAVLSAWQANAGTDDFLLNDGSWSSFDWNAIGIGISGNYAVVWFGEETDPEGP
jgi:hypothetical protein